MEKSMGIGDKAAAKILIIGGGPAGLAAAAAAKKAGADEILLVERAEEMGGILNQCIHNGFGLHTFKEELTGPEYAARYIAETVELGIEVMLCTTVVGITIKPGTEGKESLKRVSLLNKEKGLLIIEAQAVILAMGCRERPRGALNIPGYRPAGVYAAGTAQRFVNREGRMPGREAVILGSGDIGLIMARRLTLEGAKVKMVVEIMPYSGGLKRNIVQCLDDYDIPLKLSHTVVHIDGRERVKGVTVAAVDGNRKPIAGTSEYIRCDTLLLSCGLIPENELSAGLGVILDPVTAGPIVNESMETNIPGVFACGNVLHVHDLVDYVSEESAAAGENAAAYSTRLNKQNQEKEERTLTIHCKGGVKYSVPKIIRPDYMKAEQTVRFRVDNVYRDSYLTVYMDETPIFRQKKRMLAPGEMLQIQLTKEKLMEIPLAQAITIMVSEAEEGK